MSKVSTLSRRSSLGRRALLLLLCLASGARWARAGEGDVVGGPTASVGASVSATVGAAPSVDRAGQSASAEGASLLGVRTSLGSACRNVRLAQGCLGAGCAAPYYAAAQANVLQAVSFASAAGGAVVSLASMDACNQAISLPLAGAGALATFLSRQGGCTDSEASVLLSRLGLAASVASLVTSLTVHCRDRASAERSPAPPRVETPTPRTITGVVTPKGGATAALPIELQEQVIDLSTVRMK